MYRPSRHCPVIIIISSSIIGSNQLSLSLDTTPRHATPATPKWNISRIKSKSDDISSKGDELTEKVGSVLDGAGAGGVVGVGLSDAKKGYSDDFPKRSW